MKRASVLLVFVMALLAGLSRWAAAAPVTVNVTVDGVSRSAQVEPGKDTTTTPSPLVFVFHGSGQPISQVIAYGLSQAWPEATIVYPQGLHNTFLGAEAGWQTIAGDPALGDRDVRFIDGLLQKLGSMYRVDPQRIYATGVSAGGLFTYVLMEERSERFAAFAPVAAGPWPPPGLEWAATPRPVLITHGQNDNVVPLAYAEWARDQLELLNGCGPQTVDWSRGAVSFEPCSSGQPVIYAVHSGGHGWGGSDTTPNIVRFFQEHPLPGPPLPLPGEPDASRAAAGNGKPGYAGDGHPATAAQLLLPEGVAVDGAGNLFITSNGISSIRRVGPDGIIHTLLPPFPYFPGRIALDPAGNLFIASPLNRLVFKQPPKGQGSIVVLSARGGSGPVTASGDGAPAMKGNKPQAEFSFFTALAVDAQDDLYIADTQNHRVRKVDAKGIVTTVAGTGEQGFSGDSGAATAAQLNNPSGLAVDSKGYLFIADSGNHRVRKLAPDGTISTVAGNGTPGFSGDDGPAIAAQLNQPGDLAVDSQGNLFISDRRNFWVRRVAPDGSITTVFGGEPASSAGAAPAARYHPAEMAIDRTGNLIIADPLNYRVWKVAGVAAPGLLAGQPFPNP